MASIRYDQVPVVIEHGGRTERMLAYDCSLSEAADLTPVYLLGKQSIVEQTPQGARTASISFSYTPVLKGIIDVDIDKVGNYNIINELASGLKNSKASQTSGVSIRFGRISGEGLLSSYSFSLSPYSPVECTVNFELFGSGESDLPVTGALEKESPESFKLINSKLAEDVGHTAYSDFMTAGSPATITDNQETGVLQNINYSINFEYEPVYKLGQEFPAEFLYHQAREEASVTENVYETGIHFTGNGESFYLKINSLSNNNAMEIRMDDPVLSNTQASVRGGDIIQTSKTIRSFY